MLPADTAPLWQNLYCYEAISLLLYCSFAFVVVVCASRWVRYKIDIMFLKAVSRKAGELQQRQQSCATLASASCAELSEYHHTLPPQDEHAYSDEGDDPDYMAFSDQGCGDCKTKSNDSFVTGRFHI
ncbi:hypothetical protein PoB_000939700 [Plakobranchus ocellatus]|uniref:Uncharacterized protein n=1 Tax=Plakobranchus ocellatus TaxID=259542 RepID=A0AAV3YJ33_9GAST|nr:hypothetical protein PoB_000939700 [Plakobranchus ocellatus]